MSSDRTLPSEEISWNDQYWLLRVLQLGFLGTKAAQDFLLFMSMLEVEDALRADCFLKKRDKINKSDDWNGREKQKGIKQ